MNAIHSSIKIGFDFKKILLGFFKISPGLRVRQIWLMKFTRCLFFVKVKIHYKLPILLPFFKEGVGSEFGVVAGDFVYVLGCSILLTHLPFHHSLRVF